MIHPVDYSHKVRSYELDFYNHVNNAVYLSWIEQGRLEFLMSEGHSYQLYPEHGIYFVVVRIDAEYRKATYLNDELCIRTGIEKFGRTSVTFRQEIYRGEELVFTALVVIVFTNKQHQPTPIPDIFKQAFDPEYSSKKTD